MGVVCDWKAAAQAMRHESDGQHGQGGQQDKEGEKSPLAVKFQSFCYNNQADECKVVSVQLANFLDLEFEVNVCLSLVFGHKGHVAVGKVFGHDLLAAPASALLGCLIVAHIVVFCN